MSLLGTALNPNVSAHIVQSDVESKSYPIIGYPGGWVLISPDDINICATILRRTVPMRAILDTFKSMLLGQVNFFVGYDRDNAVSIGKDTEQIVSTHYIKFLADVLMQRAVLGFAMWRPGKVEITGIDGNNVEIEVPQIVSYENKVLMMRQNVLENKNEYFIFAIDRMNHQVVYPMPDTRFIVFNEPVLDGGQLNSEIMCIVDLMLLQWGLSRSTIGAEYNKQDPTYLINKIPNAKYDDLEKLKKMSDPKRQNVYLGQQNIMNVNESASRDWLQDTPIKYKYKENARLNSSGKARTEYVEGDWGRQIVETSKPNGYDKLELIIRLVEESIYMLMGHSPNQTKYQNNSNIQFTQKQFAAKLLMSKNELEKICHDVFVDLHNEELGALYKGIHAKLKKEMQKDNQLDSKLKRLDVYAKLRIVPIAGYGELISMMDKLEKTGYDVVPLVLETMGMDVDYLEKYKKEMVPGYDNNGDDEGAGDADDTEDNDKDDNGETRDKKETKPESVEKPPKDKNIPIAKTTKKKKRNSMSTLKSAKKRKR